MRFSLAWVRPIRLTGIRAHGRVVWGIGGLERMITGFNTNVRHGDRTFHVQTEDSGRKSPHVISHLYFGGTILSSEKRDYADLLGSDNVTHLVRRLMEQQHKLMLERLKRGKFDAVIVERLDGGAAQATPEAPSESTVAPAPSDEATPPPADAEPRAFGEGLVSEKPLDEVILEYLVQKARSRKTDGTTPDRG